MNPRAPRLTAAEMLRALRRDGWTIERQSSSHAQLRHPTKPGQVTVARHSGVILSPKTLAAILEQARLTTDELRDLL